ncbi:hypothetical protein [Streptomyces sp. NPDC054887]
MTTATPGLCPAPPPSAPGTTSAASPPARWSPSPPATPHTYGNPDQDREGTLLFTSDTEGSIEYCYNLQRLKSGSNGLNAATIAQATMKKYSPETWQP